MRPRLRAVADPFREVAKRDQVQVVFKFSGAEAVDRFQQRFQPEAVQIVFTVSLDRKSVV